MKKNTFNVGKMLIFSSLSTLLLNCSTDENTLENDVNLSNSSTNNLSSSSVEIKISNGNYSASTAHNSYPVSNAFDNNLNTRWSGEGTSSCIYIDLENSVSVDYVNIAFRSGNSRQYEFSYWISSDNKSWTYIQKKTSSGKSSDYETFDLSNQTTRYIRLKFQGSTADEWNNVSEIKIFGTPSSDQNIDDSNDFINTNDGVYTLDAYDIESSSHLSDDEDKTTTTESDATNTSVFGNYFKSSNGDYYLTSAAYDGKRTEWKESGESSLYTNKIMKYEASLTNVPEHGVTIAQLHNRGEDDVNVKRPFIRVYVEDGRIYIKETINDLTNSSGDWDDAVEGPKYTEGSKFKVQLTVGSGKLNIKIETTSGTLDENFTPNVTNEDYNNTYYFKAGVYSEGFDKEPTIRFYSFED